MPLPPLPLSLRLGQRRLVFIGVVALFVISASILGPKVLNLTAASDPWAALKEFFGSAFQPTLIDQNPSLPDDATSFGERLFYDWLRTIRYALIAMTLAVIMGGVLGFLASHSWWPEGRHPAKVLLKPVYSISRMIIAFMRSIHELIWVMFFYAAVGDEPITACVALAFPFAGTLAKVFSELIDEQGQHARNTYIATGATPLRAFFAALLPQAMPDLLTYALYRFECAIRSAAVLGFIGLETIGFTIRKSFENFYWQEVWTSLYVLIFTVITVEFIGSRLRRYLSTAPERKRLPKLQTLDSLKKTRPRWLSLRVGLWSISLLSIIAWLTGRELFSDRTAENRLARLERFGQKLIPDPILESGDWADLFPWASDLWHRNGAEALLNTLAISAAAIVLAAAAAFMAAPWASRTLARIDPLGLSPGKLSRPLKVFWSGLGISMRWVFVITRAVPEYILAYLLIGMMGPGAWPLVIALALHNFGILGRLWAEVIENQPNSAPESLAKTGGTRLSVSLSAILPASLNRFLLYFFYRWETCIREATILGMLGISSLGFHITLARGYFHYDRMVFYVLLGALSVIVLDVISNQVRTRLRKSQS